MARLPKVGDDKGTWGTILNDYLLKAHAEDGSLARGSVGAQQLRDGAVSTPAIADTSITTAKLRNDAVGTAQITDGAITESKLSPEVTSMIGIGAISDDSIEEAKLSSGVREKLNATLTDESVTTAKIAPGAVTPGRIEDAAVTSVKLADGAVGETKLSNAVQTKLNAPVADGSISTMKLAIGAVTSDRIYDAAVGTTKLGDGAVSEAKLSAAVQTKLNTGIADGSISTAKLADYAVTPDKISGLGAIDGIASLDADGRLAESQIPTRLRQAELASTIAESMAPVVLHVSPETHPEMLVDAGATLTEVADSVPDGSSIHIAPGKYPASRSWVVSATKRLNIEATGVCLVRESGSAVLFNAIGGYDAQRAVTGIFFEQEPVLGVDTRITRLTFGSDPQFAANDLVKLISDDAIPGGRKSSVNASSFPRMGEHMLVMSSSASEVKLVGWPFEKDSYATSIRAARMLPSSLRVDGLSFDVSDAIVAAGTTSAAVLRCDGVNAPVLNSIEVLRAVGPAIQMRSCPNYTITGIEIGRGFNNDGTILGYGIQDNGCQGGTILGGNVRFVRHAYDDKSTEVAANSTSTSGYGRTLFPTVGLKGWYTSSATFSTHQESYGVTFANCVSRGTGLAGGFSLRGSGHKVAQCSVYGADTGVSVATESGYPVGESRNIHVTDLTVEDVAVVVQANIHLVDAGILPSGANPNPSRVHVNYGVQDTETSLTIDGLVARGVRYIISAKNAKVRARNMDIKLADNPAKILISGSNSEIILGGTQWIDGTAVTTSTFTDHALIRMDSPAESVTPRNRIIQAGQMHFEPSGYFAGRFSLGLVLGDNNTEYDFPAPSSLNVYTVIGGGVFSAAPTTFRRQCTFGWRYVPHSDYPTRYDGSGSITLTNSTLAGPTGVTTLTCAPDDNLLLVASMPDNTARTLAFLPSGRRRGQRLTILRAGGTADLTVRHGAAGGTTLTSGVDMVMANGAMLNLLWAGSSWRQL